METEMAAEHGEDRGVELVRQFLMHNGGQDYKIRKFPERKGTGDQQVVRWLFDRFGHGEISMPLAPLNHDHCLSWSVLTRLREGRSLTEIVREFHCHSKTVKKLRRNFIARGLYQPSKKTTQEPTQ